MIFAKKFALRTSKWSRSFHFTSSLSFLSAADKFFLRSAHEAVQACTLEP